MLKSISFSSTSDTATPPEGKYWIIVSATEGGDSTPELGVTIKGEYGNVGFYPFYLVAGDTVTVSGTRGGGITYFEFDNE